MMLWVLFGIIMVTNNCKVMSGGILYPQESESREVIKLDGLWKFQTSQFEEENDRLTDKWFAKEFQKWIQMPVPCSYNDVTSTNLRDYVGWAWYQRSFFAPKQWQNIPIRVFLRFGSAHYESVVWVNKNLTAQHSGGHLPFQAEVTNFLHYGAENLITVAINNTLTPHTIPQGSVIHTNDTQRYPEGYVKYHFNFDYFNYAGIHRSVHLYTTPQTYIDDITVKTNINDATGIIEYKVKYKSSNSGLPLCNIRVLDHLGVKVASYQGLKGLVKIQNANFWWPYLKHENPGYLYTLEVTLEGKDGVEDVYRLLVGIRTLSWNSNQLLLNDKPIYLTGFGKHEDADFRGRGLDYPVLVRDYSLIEWLGANSYRTSHYPYAEEALDVADRLGIMIIDEAPACGLSNFDKKLLTTHTSMMRELIRRDKNHPSVIMWSLANEPLTNDNKSDSYFGVLVNFTKLHDPSRPVTFVTNQQASTDKAMHHCDVVCLNRYPAWYGDSGHLELIGRQVESELTMFHETFKKPVLVTEYGAGAMPGMHKLPAAMWTEDYQVLTLKEHFKVFDKLRSKGFLIGEMIWNFIDFATPQETFRPVWCVKGLFTRARQPKMAAHFTRTRYWALANNFSGVPLPKDLMFNP